MASSEQVNIDLTATDKASKVIGDVADDVAALEKADVEIPIGADADGATREIDALGDDIRALQRQDAEVVLRARVDAAKADLAALRADLDQTGEKAETTARQLDRVDGPGTGGGISTRGNAIADLTGPLGDASGAASDFAGVFEGLGDIAGDAATKLGATPAAVAGLSSAIGGLGVAVAAGAAIWSYWSSAQKKAEEATKKNRDAAIKLRDALKAGNIEQFADALVDQYGDVYDAAKKAGVPVEELTNFITGQADELPTLNAALRANVAAAEAQEAQSGKVSDATAAQTTQLIALVAQVDEAKRAYADGELSAAEYQSVLDEVTGTVKANTTATDTNTSALGRNRSKLDAVRQGLDNIRNGLDMQAALLTFQGEIDAALETVGSGAALTAEQVLGIKRAILDVATAAGATPIEVESTMKKIDDGDLAGARADAEAWYRRNPVNITGVIRPTSQGVGPGGGGGVPIGLAAPDAVNGAGTVIHVTQILPRGYRERDVLAAATGAARRAGGTYRRSRR